MSWAALDNIRMALHCIQCSHGKKSKMKKISQLQKKVSKCNMQAKTKGCFRTGHQPP